MTRQRQPTKRVQTVLPKLPPFLGRKVSVIWRRRSSVMDDNGEDQHLNASPSLSAPSFKCYVLPSFKDAKNDDDDHKNDSVDKELLSNTGIKSVENLELRTFNEKMTRKMKFESKEMKLWRVVPRAKLMKNLIYIKPSRTVNIRYGRR